LHLFNIFIKRFINANLEHLVFQCEVGDDHQVAQPRQLVKFPGFLKIKVFAHEAKKVVVKSGG
jgi:hypothetical protein